MDKTFRLQWECAVRCYPGPLGLPVAVAGHVAMLVAATSKMVGLLVVLCGTSNLGANHGIMGK